MTQEEFRTLTEAGTVILDGATGSNMTKAGMEKGVSTELWILEHPDVLMDLQKAYLEAGSQIIYAPTFTCNPCGMKNFGKEKEIYDLNCRLVELSRKAVGDRAYVAGDITTTGKMLEPRGEMSFEGLMEIYIEQVKALCDAGVDLIVAETMLSVDETAIAVEAVRQVTDLPMMCSLSVEADGSAYFGGTAWEAVETLQELGANAVGVNCSVGPDQLEGVVRMMKKVAKVPVIAKPNAGMPNITESGEAVYDMEPKAFARHMHKLWEAGASILGGCCGTTPEYIRELSAWFRR